jgi:predicted TIM-barrel fold metal-dependent hydrolase
VVAMQMADPLVTMVFSGVLDRHPGLRLVLAESGLGWVPYLVHRMDAVSERWAPDWRRSSDRPPSELFGERVFVTFEEERGGAEYLGLLPPGTAMWASDYPHADSTFPRSREVIADSLAGLDEASARAVTGGTCRRLYGFA